ncbi:MAG: VOC family protein [Anaerolinea sp.]|nr:VOC family protein [Anaerolinea sp.]
MSQSQSLRGFATVNYFADDVKAARQWYGDLLGIEAYFQRPDADNPQYVEFRVGIIDRKFVPKGAASVPGGAVIYWHVDDAAAMMDKLKAMGAREYEPIIRRGDAGFITAAVIDPFGNVLGVMYNPHYVAKRLRVDQQSKTNQQYWLRKRWSSRTSARMAAGSCARCH